MHETAVRMGTRLQRDLTSATKMLRCCFDLEDRFSLSIPIAICRLRMRMSPWEFTSNNREQPAGEWVQIDGRRRAF